MYDAIIVGARCAGSPTAMLLARKGYRVLVLDRATFPSDIMRNHFIQRPGMLRLKRWGLLDRLIATNCPPILRFTTDLGDFPLSGVPPQHADLPPEYAPRRTVLDKLLVDAAVEAGAEVREAFVVQELLMQGEQVVGIRGKHNGGATVAEQARIVVGADGCYSLVARTVQAPVYDAHPKLTWAYYSYWSNVPIAGVEVTIRNEGAFVVAFPTNDGLVCVGAQGPMAQFHAFRANLEGNFLKHLEIAPSLAERVRGGRREERFLGTGDLPNFFRKPYGPGWALVGDAGYHKDPFSAQGISDAFRDAELLSDAIDAGLSERRPLEEALADYERQRNAAAVASYQETCARAAFQPVPPHVLQERAAIRGDQEVIDLYYGIGAGTVDREAFYGMERVKRLMHAVGRDPVDRSDARGQRDLP